MSALVCGGRGPCCHVGYPHRHCEHCDVVIALQHCHHSYGFPYGGGVYYGLANQLQGLANQQSPLQALQALSDGTHQH